jgi:hypothetical protein
MPLPPKQSKRLPFPGGSDANRPIHPQFCSSPASVFPHRRPLKKVIDPESSDDEGGVVSSAVRSAAFGPSTQSLPFPASRPSSSHCRIFSDAATTSLPRRARQRSWRRTTKRKHPSRPPQRRPPSWTRLSSCPHRRPPRKSQALWRDSRRSPSRPRSWGTQRRPPHAQHRRPMARQSPLPFPPT